MKNEIAMTSKLKTIASAGLFCAVVLLSPIALPMQAHAQYDNDPQAEVDRLSDQLRKLTGQNEELQHRNRVLEDQLRQLQGGAAPGAAAAPAARGPDAGAPPYQNQQYQNQPYHGQGQPPPPAYQGQQGAPMNLENNNGGAAPPPAAGASLTTAPPTQSPKDEFDLGLGYMQRKDYGLAEETMRNFTEKYPYDRLVADAQYWLGESLFQRKKYREAAEAFLGVTSNYDNSA